MRKPRPAVAARIRAETGRELRDALAMALVENDYVASRAATALGIDKSTFSRLCSRHGVRTVHSTRVIVTPRQET